MEGKHLRIVYLGTPDFAVLPLQKLVEAGYDVAAVVTMPDKPAGRGLKLQESAVKRYAVQAGLPVLQPVKLRDPEFIAALEALKPDLGIVIAFRMLPEMVWRLPRLGTFNLHASLLPQDRGAAPINWALMNGDRVTGVTTFLLNEEIDKGAVIGQKKVEISEEDTAGTLHDKLMEAGAELVLQSVEQVAAGGFVPVEQREMITGELRPAPKIFKDTCRIDWTSPCEVVRHKVRGLSAYPAAWSEMVSGAERIPVKIYAVNSSVQGISGEVPGTIRTDGKTALDVACGDGTVSVRELQLAGKKRMTVEEFLRGFKRIGDYRME